MKYSKPSRPGALPASKVRERFADVLDEVAVRGERVVLQRHGKDVAAIISSDDLKLLEMLEDKYDIDAARRALAQPGAPIPWEAVKKKLGL